MKGPEQGPHGKVLLRLEGLDAIGILQALC